MSLAQNTANRLVAAMCDQAAATEIQNILEAAQVLSGTEAGYIDSVTPGTAAENKAVVLTTNKVIDTIDITAPKINGTAVTATAAELNARNHLQPAGASITPAAAGSNVCEVAIAIKDGQGTPVAVTGPVVFDVLLSDSATGAGLTNTTASGAVQAKASSGTDLSTLVSKKALKVQSKADGTYTLSITDTAKTQFYVVVQIPGLKAIVQQILTANYG